MPHEPFASIETALAWLDGHIDYERVAPTRRSLPSLGSMREMATLLGEPQQSYPVIHITGTNGKGSTTAMVSALLAAMGLHVGTYTSPNLHVVNERIARNGVPISNAELIEVLSSLAIVEDLVAETPTRFELLTMAAFRHFSDEAVDVGVIEVGLGGTWDSTNIADGEVAVITTIDLDHVDVLGATRREIALDKVGIVKAGAAFVIGPVEADIADLLATTAHGAHAGSVAVVGEQLQLGRNDLAVGGRLLDLDTVGGHYDDVFLSLHGAHQGQNALVALATVEAFFGEALPDDMVREVFATMAVPGRLEVLGHNPLVLVDGAHNPAGVDALVDAVTEAFSVSGRTILVTGMLHGRDPSAMLAPFGDLVDEVIACAPESPRAIDADVVRDAARELGMSARSAASVQLGVDEALGMAGDDDLVLVAGSLYVAGSARWRLLHRP